MSFAMSQSQHHRAEFRMVGLGLKDIDKELAPYLLSPWMTYAEDFLICSLYLLEQGTKRNGESRTERRDSSIAVTPSPLGATRIA